MNRFFSHRFKANWNHNPPACICPPIVPKIGGWSNGVKVPIVHYPRRIEFPIFAVPTTNRLPVMPLATPTYYRGDVTQ